MEKFNKLTSPAAPLPLVNVDTDMIIPKQFLKTIKRTGLSSGLFFEMRFDGFQFLKNHLGFRVDFFLPLESVRVVFLAALVNGYAVLLYVHTGVVDGFETFFIVNAFDCERHVNIHLT